MSGCRVDNCTRSAKSLGYCHLHYQRALRGADMNAPARPSVKAEQCIHQPCADEVIARAMCLKHYTRSRRAGTAKPPRPVKSERPTRPPCSCGARALRNYGPLRGVCAKCGHAQLVVACFEGRIIGTDFGDGYRRVQAGSRKYPVHRLVMEHMLGRPLVAGEEVHHINGVRGDNRPENLEFWPTSQPPGQRVADKVEWAVHILQMYAPSLLANPSSTSTKEHINHAH